MSAGCHQVVQGAPPAEGAIQKFRVPARHDVRWIYERHHDRGKMRSEDRFRRGGGGNGILEGCTLCKGVAEFELVVEDLRGREW